MKRGKKLAPLLVLNISSIKKRRNSIVGFYFLPKIPKFPLDNRAKMMYNDIE
jgi:hypothetical protein